MLESGGAPVEAGSVGITLSDHYPILLTLDAPVSALDLRSHQIPDSIYNRDEVRRQIELLWTREWSEGGQITEEVAEVLGESSRIC